jgi:alpha-tubulin suppressor-like RCC1 family protein
VQGLSGVVAIAAGGDDTCAVLAGGTVECWGDTSVALGATFGRGTLETIGSLSSIVEVTLGAAHACALSSAGTTKCWGQNEYGQIGDESTNAANPPVSVPVVGGGTKILAMAAGGNQTCALLPNGTFYCWGNDKYDQIGAISVTPSTCLGSPCVEGPAAVNSGAPVQAIASGGQSPAHTCVLLSGGTVSCWGDDTDGELGAPVTGTLTACPASGYVCTDTARAVAGVTGATAISAGDGHTCALLSGGSVWCWGLNTSGQLGNGTISSYSDAGVQMAAAVPGLAGATSISAGGQHTCALVAGGAVQCWGDNSYGQLGTGSASGRVPSPTPVSL